MGMFDRFEGKWICKCGHQNEDDDIQTKELDCMMDHYEVGDKVSDKYNYVLGVSMCEGCKTLKYVRINFEDGYYNGDIKYESEW